MSCADVCLSHDYDESNDFYSERMQTARREHVCCECFATIPIGARYEYVCGKTDGDVWTAKTCAACAEIRKAFVCGSWRFGVLWDSIGEEMFPIWKTDGPIDCLAKLESFEARDKARDQFRQWEENRA